MARISTISIKQMPEHYTLTVRRTIDFLKEYAAFAKQTLACTGDYLSKMGQFPMSGPIACFYNTDLENLDVEMGWQITQPVQCKEDIVCDRIPEQKLASAIDLGPYEEQDATLADLLAWAKANGYALQGPICYCYLNDTDRPSEQYITQMLLPVDRCEDE